jgi:hypothetical protein
LTVRIAILVEGATEAVFKDALHRWLKAKVPDRMPKLSFLKQNGRLPKEDKLKRMVTRLLSDYDAVIALTDVYTGTNPPDFTDAADAKAKMRAWVGDEPKFYPHAAQHDFEAWLLPYWDKVRALAGSDRNRPAANPETVNHGHTPSRHLQDVFLAGSKKRSYSKTRDAAAILRDQDLSVAASACPELQAFLDTVLALAGSPT